MGNMHMINIDKLTSKYLSEDLASQKAEAEAVVKKYATEYRKKYPRSDFDDIFDYVQSKAGFDIMEVDAEKIIDDVIDASLETQKEFNPKFKSASKLKDEI
jgi:hypothetical protein